MFCTAHRTASIAALSLVACLAAAAPAAATVTMTSIAAAPDAGPLPGERLVVTFDAPNAAGYTWVVEPLSRIGSLAGTAAAPTGVTGRFGYVTTARGGVASATLLTPALRSLSLHWGSIDGHNRVEILGDGMTVLGSFGGNLFQGASGSWTDGLSNRRVQFIADALTPIRGVRFAAQGVAFEFDSIAANAVPEPASWAMLITGFGLAGAAMRRRRLHLA